MNTEQKNQHSSLFKLLNINKLCFVFSLCILVSGADAQDFNAGLGAGLSSSQVSGDNLAGFNKAGIILGGFVNRDISDKWLGQFEILYIQKGSRDPDGLNYTIRLAYVEVPILLRFKHSKRLSYEVGPSIGALVSSSERDLYGERSFIRPFNRTEIAANIGLNYHFNDSWFLNWRISNSVLPIRDHVAGSTFRWNRGQYSTMIHLTFRYQF